MNSLRTELIESQKVRSDLLKWKLLIISGVGATALGFSGDGPGNSHHALAVIPLACFYVDLCCRHLSLRINAIGMFIQYGEHTDIVLKEYELFYSRISKYAWSNFSLESVALLGLTILVSFAIIPIGILAGDVSETMWKPFSWPALLFYSSGILGIVSTSILQFWYVRQRENMEKVAANK